TCRSSRCPSLLRQEEEGETQSFNRRHLAERQIVCVGECGCVCGCVCVCVCGCGVCVCVCVCMYIYVIPTDCTALRDRLCVWVSECVCGYMWTRDRRRELPLWILSVF